MGTGPPAWYRQISADLDRRLGRNTYDPDIVLDANLRSERFGVFLDFRQNLTRLFRRRGLRDIRARQWAPWIERLFDEA